MRQEDIISLLVQNVLYCTVGNLGREAVGRLNSCHACMRNLIRKNCPDSQLVEVPCIERVKCVDRECLGDTYSIVPLLDKAGLVWSESLEHKVITLIHKVADLGLVEQLLLPGVGVFGAPSAEHILVAVYLKDTDRALVLAGFALELAFVYDLGLQNLVDVEGSLGDEPFVELLLSQKTYAEASHELRIRRHQNLLAQKECKCQRDSLVLGHATLEEYLVAHSPVSHNSVKVVGDDGGDNSCSDVGPGGTLLDSLADI